MRLKKRKKNSGWTGSNQQMLFFLSWTSCVKHELLIFVYLYTYINSKPIGYCYFKKLEISIKDKRNYAMWSLFTINPSTCGGVMRLWSTQNVDDVYLTISRLELCLYLLSENPWGECDAPFEDLGVRSFTLFSCAKNHMKAGHIRRRQWRCFSIYRCLYKCLWTLYHLFIQFYYYKQLPINELYVIYIYVDCYQHLSSIVPG